MAIALVTSLAAVFGGSGGTTSSINTTGATLLVVGLWYHAGTAENLTDSKGNTWTKLTKQVDANMGTVLYYCTNPTVGSGHTFSTTSHFVGVGVGAFSGTRTASTPFDLENGAHANASGNLQPGSITPTVNDCLVVSAFGTFNGTSPSMPTGYSLIAANTTATAEGGGMGYKIQTSASAENPTWNSTGSSQCAVIADFFPPAVAPTTNGKFFAFF